MLKWVVGIVLALVLLVAGSCWYTYRNLTREGTVATVTVRATPEHVWALLTEPDSIRSWYDTAATVSFSTDSTLAVGDSIILRSTGSTRPGSGLVMVLDRAERPSLLVWGMRGDSVERVILERTDSIVAQGDSVRIVSVSSTPAITAMTDSLGGFSRRLVGAGSRMAAGGMRMMVQRQLEALRDRLNP
jgi:uncharacterized protein YndB with AHSA1/START domain